MYSVSRRLQKRSSLSFARFQDLLDILLVDASAAAGEGCCWSEDDCTTN